MLVWSLSGRVLVWSFAALLLGVIFVAPLAVIMLASFSQQWNGVLPTGFTLEHYRDATGGAARDAVYASLVTGFVASLLALVTGAWAALALARPRGPVGERARAAVLHSERRALGLGRPRPARRVQPEAAAAQRHDGDRLHRALRADLGLRVRQHLGRAFAPCARLRGGRLLPRRAPRLSAAARHACRWSRPISSRPFGLSFALSMGELGATVMVYPPGWVTMPVAIFGLTDRGDIFSGAALTMILVVATLVLLLGLERAPIRSAAPR